MQNFDVEMVLPAHGGIYHDHRHRANQLIEHHRYREAEMLDIVKRKPNAPSKLPSRSSATKTVPIFHVMAATFETLAHLELARIEGRAKTIEHDGLTLYQAV